MERPDPHHCFSTHITFLQDENKTVEILNIGCKLEHWEEKGIFCIAAYVPNGH
jgi:hypothetical protein